MGKFAKYAWVLLALTGCLLAGEKRAEAFSAAVGFSANGPMNYKTLGGGTFDQNDAAVVLGSKVYVVGHFFDSNFRSHTLVGRLNRSDGSVDTSFGLGGIELIQVDTGPEANERPLSIAIDPTTSQLVILGISIDDPDGAADTFVVKMNQDGSLDNTFGIRKPFHDASGNPTLGVGVAAKCQSDGSVVALGWSGDADQRTFSVARLDRHGNPLGSVVTNNFASGIGNYPTDLAIDSLNRVVVVGESPSIGTAQGKQLMGVVRFTSALAIDTSFNRTGKQLINIGLVNNQTATGVAIDTNNRVIVVGRPDNTAENTNGAAVLISRLKADGTVDGSTLFMFSGTVVDTNFRPNWRVANVGNDFYIVGNARTGAYQRFALTKFLGSTLRADPNFNGGAQLSIVGFQSKNAVPVSLSIGSDLNPVAVGYASRP